MPFQNNVFINCPFDDEYKPLLKALIFTVLYLGYKPKISQTESSSNIRINQIKALIKDSKYGIHDLSRCRAMNDGDLPRFNMPYELGLDIGCQEFGTRKLKTKKILILEKERYHYQKVLSDIAGQDIQNHDDDPKVAVRKVRDWFSGLSARKQYQSATEIWSSYNIFCTDLTDKLGAKFSTQDIEDMPISEFIKFSKRWINSSIN
jgi:hypothetical protein